MAKKSQRRRKKPTPSITKVLGAVISVSGITKAVGFDIPGVEPIRNSAERQIGKVIPQLSGTAADVASGLIAGIAISKLGTVANKATGQQKIPFINLRP